MPELKCFLQWLSNRNQQQQQRHQQQQQQSHFYVSSFSLLLMNSKCVTVPLLLILHSHCYTVQTFKRDLLMNNDSEQQNDGCTLCSNVYFPHAPFPVPVDDFVFFPFSPSSMRFFPNFYFFF